MNQAKLWLRALFVPFLMWSVAACTTEIYAPRADNPPPAEVFSSFGHYRLESVKLNPAYAEHGYNHSARAAIERNLLTSLGPVLQSWEKEQGRTLLIEPYIEEIKFIGGAARFWAGAYAGSSAVVMRVDYKDAETNSIIAAPIFYQHANAMGGAWTFGASDNAMLSRIASLVTTYTTNNYRTAVGGPSGAPADRIRPAA